MNKYLSGLSFLKLSKEERHKFLKYNYKEDKYNFSSGALVAALIILFLIPVEYLKVHEFNTTCWFRVLSAFSYIIVYKIVSGHRGSVKGFQWLSLTFILLATLLLISNDYFAKGYALFLPNSLTALIFFLHILSGLYFSKSLLVNCIMLLLFTIYAWTLGEENTFLFEEMPDLVSTSVLAAFFGYLMQKNKYNRYEQSLVIEAQYDEIRKEHDEYQKLNTVKDRLLSILSHDVRSPLDSLKGFVYLLENQLLSEAEVKELLSELKIKLDRTTEFVGHTLLWTKNQIGGFSPNPLSMNVKDMLQKTVDLYDHHIREKQIRISINCADHLHIKADEEMAYIVARNLLNNAIKFTTNSKSITLAAEATGEQVIISISDEGIGISNEQIAHIFNVIQQPSLGTRGEKGTGLGLSLSKELMEKIGGDLTIASNHPQAGTTCYMVFPKAKAE